MALDFQAEPPQNRTLNDGQPAAQHSARTTLPSDRTVPKATVACIAVKVSPVRGKPGEWCEPEGVSS